MTMLMWVGGLAGRVAGHGAMINPPPRNSRDGVLPFFDKGACGNPGVSHSDARCTRDVSEPPEIAALGARLLATCCPLSCSRAWPTPLRAGDFVDSALASCLHLPPQGETFCYSCNCGNFTRVNITGGVQGNSWVGCDPGGACHKIRISPDGDAMGAWGYTV